MNVFAMTKDDILHADLALQPGFLDFLEEKGVFTPLTYIHAYIHTFYGYQAYTPYRVCL
jgi:hypothetical protein